MNPSKLSSPLLDLETEAHLQKSPINSSVSQDPTEITRATNDLQPKKTIFESLYERRFTRRFVASVEDARSRRNSKSSSANPSAPPNSLRGSFTNPGIAPTSVRAQDPVANPRRSSFPGKRISTDSKNSRGEEIIIRNSTRSFSVPYTRQPHLVPKEEIPTVVESGMYRPEVDAPLQLPEVDKQVLVPLTIPSAPGTELPPAGDLALTSSDQTTYVTLGMDLEGHVKSEALEGGVQLTTGASAELPRNKSTDVYRVPAYVPSLSSYGELSPVMAITMSRGSFEDHLPTSFSLMNGSLMDEAMEFCHDIKNEQGEAFGTHQRLPREVVERTDCRPQHTSIWGVCSRTVTTGRITSSDSLPTVCEVLRPEKSMKSVPVMANEIQLTDNHDISIQRIQGQERVAPMEQAPRPTTFDTCSPLCGTPKQSGRSSTMVSTVTDFNNKQSVVENALDILSPVVTEGASVVVPQVAEDEHETSCREWASSGDCTSHILATNVQEFGPPEETGTSLDSTVKPNPSATRECILSAGGASLQFPSASIDQLTMSEASETLAIPSLNPEEPKQNATGAKTLNSTRADAVFRDFFSIQPPAPPPAAMLAQASSTTTSSTTSPAPASKQPSAQAEEMPLPLNGQLYKKRSYSSSAVDDDNEHGLKITDAILFKAFTPPFRFRIEGPSTKDDSQFEKLDTSQSKIFAFGFKHPA
ncbi:hypothetical protein AAHC03_09825 [Spirometra sp. Aus1]